MKSYFYWIVVLCGVSSCDWADQRTSNVFSWFSDSNFDFDCKHDPHVLLIEAWEKLIGTKKDKTKMWNILEKKLNDRSGS